MWQSLNLYSVMQVICLRELLHFKLAEDVHQYRLIVDHSRLPCADLKQSEPVVLLGYLQPQAQLLYHLPCRRRWVDADVTLTSTIAVNYCIHFSTTLRMHARKNKSIK